MSNKIINTDSTLEEAWKKVLSELEKAAKDPSHSFRNTMLSTIGSSAHPESRTVILRDFVQGEQLLIYTDRRSDKVAQVEDNNRVSMLFYDEVKKLQLRVKGHGVVHLNGQLVSDHLKHVSKRSASSYTTVKSPGEEITEPSAGWEWDESDLENFCVMDITITEMEFLQLNRNQHLRGRRTFKDGGMREDSWLVP